MQNSEAEDGAVKEEARRREIIKGNATNGGTVARTPVRSAQRQFQPFGFAQPNLTATIGTRDKEANPYWRLIELGTASPEAPGAASNPPMGRELAD